MPAVFIAHVEEQLQPQADAEEGFARFDGIEHWLDQVEPAQLGDGVFEGPHARQHDLGGGGHLGRIAGHHGLLADLLEGLLHAPQVAHAVVDDGDHDERGQGPGAGARGQGRGVKGPQLGYGRERQSST